MSAFDGAAFGRRDFGAMNNCYSRDSPYGITKIPDTDLGGRRIFRRRLLRFVDT